MLVVYQNLEDNKSVEAIVMISYWDDETDYAVKEAPDQIQEVIQLAHGVRDPKKHREQKKSA